MNYSVLSVVRSERPSLTTIAHDTVANLVEDLKLNYEEKESERLKTAQWKTHYRDFKIFGGGFRVYQLSLGETWGCILIAESELPLARAFASSHWTGWTPCEL